MLFSHWSGHILAFNYTIEKPECKCQDGFVYHPDDGACYELNTPGPCYSMARCEEGTPCFMRSMDTLQDECRQVGSKGDSFLITIPFNHTE